ncbi:MAG: acyltransferase [Oscillospiraceae bacterium]|jgi:peptidoglycan/LPS O-acetylase OafA/YrhL/Tfp pilus assembly protein PilN|nr:acyltransferase [Oscillospiraceae bacterium]
MRIRWFSIVRVLGLSLVLVYHFFPKLLPGGFLGVDVFFVFSGYLITALLLEEYRKSGRFSLLAYARRRFLRIFPALACAVGLALPFALLVAPDFTADLRRQAAAALGFITNYYETLRGGGYEARLLPHLLLHTWSLAVEAHFYIIWGLLFAVLSRLYTKCAPRRRADLRIALFGVALLLAGLSYLKMFLAVREAAGDFSAPYYSTASHGFPFMLGAAVGALFGMRTGERAARLLKMIPVRALSATGLCVSVAGLGVLAAKLSFAEQKAFLLGMPLAGIFSALLIFSARVLHESVSSRRGEPKLLSVLGELSYNMYLYHWPLFIVLSQRVKPPAGAALASFSLSLAFSAFEYYLLEPVWQGKALAIKLKFAKPALAALLCACVGLNGYMLYRAPAVNSIEEGLLLQEIAQDADAVRDVKRLAAALHPRPVRFADGFNALPQLQKSLPKPLKPPAAAAPSASAAKPVSGILRGVSVIGDSVCLDARTALLAAMPNCVIDAKGSRNLTQGLALLRAWVQADVLRETVIVALGANGIHPYVKAIEDIAADLPPGHRLIFVTPFDGRWDAGWSAYKTMQYMRTLEAKYSYVTVADWAAAIDGRADLLQADKTHFKSNAADAPAIQIYTNCLLDALLRAARRPAKS